MLFKNKEKGGKEDPKKVQPMAEVKRKPFTKAKPRVRVKQEMRFVKSVQGSVAKVLKTGVGKPVKRVPSVAH